MILAQRGLLVLLDQPVTSGLSALLGPRGLRENPVLLANRVRLETLEQLVRPVPMVLPARKDRRVILAMPEPQDHRER